MLLAEPFGRDQQRDSRACWHSYLPSTMVEGLYQHNRDQVESPEEQNGSICSIEGWPNSESTFEFAIGQIPYASSFARLLECDIASFAGIEAQKAALHNLNGLLSQFRAFELQPSS